MSQLWVAYCYTLIHCFNIVEEYRPDSCPLKLGFDAGDLAVCEPFAPLRRRHRTSKYKNNWIKENKTQTMIWSNKEDCLIVNREVLDTTLSLHVQVPYVFSYFVQVAKMNIYILCMLLDFIF